MYYNQQNSLRFAQTYNNSPTLIVESRVLDTYLVPVYQLLIPPSFSARLQQRRGTEYCWYHRINDHKFNVQTKRFDRSQMFKPVFISHSLDLSIFFLSI